MNIEPILLLNYDKWLSYREEITTTKLQKIIQTVLNNIQINLKGTTIELCVVLESDKEIQRLNKEFRSKDKSTNVLSFPLHAIKPGQNIENLVQDSHIYLGDIVLSYETLQKEIELQRKTFMHHFTHLLVHSILHLLGYDHEIDEEAEQMEALEVKILNHLNISSPYLI